MESKYAMAPAIGDIGMSADYNFENLIQRRLSVRLLTPPIPTASTE